MKKTLVSVSLVALAVIAFASGKDSDSVLLTVDGKPVMKSEFEYIYHKTNSQQLTPQTIEEYLPLFIDYRLKVAEGDAERVDTTAEFRDEVAKYRRELAQGHMFDSVLYKSLYDQAYAFAQEEVKVAHIMRPLGNTPASVEQETALLDSLRTAILNSADPAAEWNAAASKYSVDMRSKDNGGLQGWIDPFTLPFWSFEEASYETPVGQISPVVNSSVGLHLIKPLARRPARGEVKAAHILMLTGGMSQQQADSVKTLMDSIYNVAIQPDADFAALARKYSQDPGSASKGGELDWFGTGRMVPEFDSVAFATPDGQISKPFRTDYGYHIVKNMGHRPVSVETLDSKIKAGISGDERAMLPHRSYVDGVVADFKGEILEPGLDKVQAYIEASDSGYTPQMRALLEDCNIVVARVAGKDIPVSAVMHSVASTASRDAANARRLIKTAAQRQVENDAIEADLDRLFTQDADYRNVLNEYINGNKLFAVQYANVYEKAARDREGLEKFFKANRDKYKWDKPKYKGYIIFANNDSLLNEARAFCDSVGTNINKETFAGEISKRFGRTVKAERVIAAQGDNPISDYLFFNGPRPEDKDLRYKSFFGFGGHLAQQPEEAIDVRGAVITDYQDAIMEEWVAGLRKKYPVKVNQKVLKTCK